MGCGSSKSTEAVKTKIQQGQTKSNYQKVDQKEEQKVDKIEDKKEDQKVDQKVQKKPEEEQIDNNELQKEAYQISEEIYKIAQGSGDKYQLRSLRQRLSKLDLHLLYAPYNVILNLMQALGSLFINRGSQVNFLAELKHIARLCRILVVHFLSKKNFLTTEHQQQYSKIIQSMLNIMSKTKQETYDFGFQIELEVIQKVVKLAQDDELLRNKLILKVSQLYKI